MSKELSRAEKVRKLDAFGILDRLYTMCEQVELTDQEINDLYEEHFEITQEDFEGFEKVMNYFEFYRCEGLGYNRKEIEEIKKELGL